MTTPPKGAQTWPDGVEVDPISPAGLAGYAQAREQLQQFQVPKLVESSNPHARMYVANFDGTGNDKYADPQHITNIGIVDDQILAARRKNHDLPIASGYVTGVGSSPDWASKNLDGGLGYTYGPRMEEMYLKFITQAKEWRDSDPKAQISLLSTGFSRGAVTAAMFTRMIEERGIQDPIGMHIERDDQGRILKLTPTRPDLVPPGQTRQAVVLLDPVATGVMNMKDVRLPPSVVSGLQITANNEFRDEFYGKPIISPGISADGRFANLAVDAAHCDIGGSYLLNGLSTRNFNLMAGYVNALSDRPFAQARTVPSAPEMNVIHHSEQHRNFYTTLAADVIGQRVHNPELAGSAITFNRFDAEPANPALMRGLHRAPVHLPPEQLDPRLPDFFKDKPQPAPIPPHIDSWTPLFNNAPMSMRDQHDAQPVASAPQAEQPGIRWDPRFLAATDAGLRGDAQGIALAGHQYASAGDGQQWLQQGQALNQQVERQAELDRQAQLQAQPPAHDAPVMRIG